MRPLSEENVWLPWARCVNRGVRRRGGRGQWNKELLLLLLLEGRSINGGREKEDGSIKGEDFYPEKYDRTLLKERN